jgi:hypothetical protein
MTDSTRSSSDNAAANSRGDHEPSLARSNALPLDKKTTSRFLWAQAEFTVIHTLTPSSGLVTVGGGASSVHELDWGSYTNKSLLLSTTVEITNNFPSIVEQFPGSEI